MVLHSQIGGAVVAASDVSRPPDWPLCIAEGMGVGVGGETGPRVLIAGHHVYSTVNVALTQKGPN